MILSYLELYALVFVGGLLYVALMGSVAALIATSLIAKGHIDSGANPQGDISPDDSRDNLTKASEYSAIIAGLALIGLILSILTGVGLFFGA